MNKVSGIYRFFRGSFDLIRRGFRSVLIFELIYRVLLAVVIAPLAKLLILSSLHLSVGGVLTNANFFTFATNPIAIVLVAAALGIFAFYVLFEVAGVLILLDYAARKKTISVRELIPTAFIASLRLFSPKNWPLFFFAFLVMPFTSLGVTSSLLDTVTIPTYIAEVIHTQPMLWGGATLLVLVATWLAVTYLLVFNPFFLEGKDGFESAKISRRLMTGGRIGALAGILILNLALGLGSDWVGGILIHAAQRFGTEVLGSLGGIAFFLAGVKMVHAGCQFALAVLSVLIVYVPVTLLYRHVSPAPSEKPTAVSPPTKKWSRRWRILFFGSIGVAFVIEGGIFYSTLADGGLFRPQTILFIGHRGVTGDVPENSIPAFERAITEGVDWIELDVQLTRDRVVVVTHDTNLKSLTGRDAEIYDLTLAEVQQLDIGGGFGPEFAGTRIPTLDEVIRHCRGRAKLNIEIKTNSRDHHIEPEVLSVIRANQAENDLVVCSLSHNVVEQMKTLAPGIQTGLILTIAAGNFYDTTSADFFSIESSFLTPKVVEECRRRGKPAYGWTIDTPDDMKQMIRLRADGVITGKPALMKNIFENQTSPIGRIESLIFD